MDQSAANGGQPHDVTSIEQLESLYGEAVPLSITKELDVISDDYGAYIEAAPFMVVATSGPGGLDCSPRGDPPGFVRIVDKKTVMFADRRGNNRLDTLRNIVADPRIALLFLIPGIEVTMRINGRARISMDPDLRASFEMQGKVPATVIIVTVESIYTQCPKALVRSKIWDPESQIPKSGQDGAGPLQGRDRGGEVRPGISRAPETDHVLRRRRPRV